MVFVRTIWLLYVVKGVCGSISLCVALPAGSCGAHQRVLFLYAVPCLPVCVYYIHRVAADRGVLDWLDTKAVAANHNSGVFLCDMEAHICVERVDS